MTGRCAQRGSEHTQSWQVGPVCSRWLRRRLRLSRWLGHSPEAIRLGQIIYAVLFTKIEGKAVSIVHLTARGAGAEAWRLRAEYAGSSGARLGIMMREVVCPSDQCLADVSAGEGFLT